MDKNLIRSDLEKLSSEELLDIWNAYDLGKYKREAFPVIKEILVDRGVDVPLKNLASFIRTKQVDLVNCKACGKEIGDSVSICIHCGTDQRNFFLRHKIITFFLVMLVIGTINRATGTKTSTATTPASPPVAQATNSMPTTPEVVTTTPTENPIKITAKRLEQEYDDNQFAADEKYKGKLVEVIGATIAIDRDFSNNPYIELAAEASGGSVTNVWCRFNEDNASSLAKVDKNHEVTIQGICDGINGDVYLRNCKVTGTSDEPIPSNGNKSILSQIYESQNQTNNQAQNTSVTKEQAIQMVKQIVNKNILYKNDHDEVVNGLDCYVIHAYEIVDDGGGAGHTATAGWYAVQKSNGKIFNDLLDNTHLHPLN